MSNDYKVLIDTCVLIAASVNHSCVNMKGVITEKFYAISKPLFEHFQKNPEKRQGVVIQDTLDKARFKISDIVYRHITKIERDGNLKIRMDEHSLALSKIQDSLNAHIGFLGIIRYNDEKFLIIRNRVKKFYDSVIKIIDRNDPRDRIRQRISGCHGIFRHYERQWAREDESPNFAIKNKLKRKFIEERPDQEDINILSHAAYLKAELPEGNIVYIASTDHHFCSINIDGSLSTLIPDEIEKRFHIKCEWPNRVLPELIKSS